MNLFDLGAVLLTLFAVVVGFRSGALPQLGGLAGAVGGGALGLFALPLAQDVLQRLDPAPRAILVLVGLLFAVGVGEAIGSAVGRGLARELGTGFLGAIDRTGGAFVGLAQAILVVWLAGGLLAAGPLERLAGQAQTSLTVRALDRILPPPTEIAVEFGRLLDETGLPDVFVGLEPLPAPPVDRPDDPTARAIAALAESSTVRVSAAACSQTSVGTGFVVARGYVVTNAHVVAGGRTVRVNLRGNAYDATPVLFDPRLDVALLLVSRLEAPALRFAAADPGRGTVGAALGYPGGEALAIVPAAVAGRYDAQGRDIYATERVRRTVLELRADIDRGDSGGPFVLADGTVGGVVFAESRTNEEVGYALTATSVATTIAPAVGRTGAVATGSCLD